MNDWIGLAVIGFIALCGLFALWQLSKPYEVGVEEFEKRAAEAPSLLSVGFVGLQKILDPATAKAVEAQEDFKEGRFDSEQAKGDGDEAGADGRRQAQEAGADGRGQAQEAGADGRKQKAEGRSQKSECRNRSSRGPRQEPEERLAVTRFDLKLGTRNSELETRNSKLYLW